MTSTNAFTPSAENSRSLRDAYSKFTTGITVVTANAPSGPVGMTANSFSSISLDPPLVLWAASLHSRRLPVFKEAEHFAIHVLSDKQRDVCDAFAQSANAFGQVDHRFNANNVPLLHNCLARFECKFSASYPAGDHLIIVGEVEEVELSGGNALTFFDGDFKNLSME